MACNVGGIERPVRIVLGVIVLVGMGACSADLTGAAVGAGLAVAMGTIALVTGAHGVLSGLDAVGDQHLSDADVQGKKS
jgi:hypothetical protein